MIKTIAIMTAATLAFAPIVASAAELAVMGGPAGAPPNVTSGPGNGVTVQPGQPTAAPPMVGQVPRGNAPPATSRNKEDCVKTVCSNSNGGGGG